MANRSENSEIAVLQTQMDQVLKGIDDIQKKLDTFATVSRVVELETRVKQLNHKKTLQSWVTGLLSAILGIILTILVQSYLEK